ncbi:type a von willebrand factor domain-containing protein [Stylonychia lemnae]|uniref:Type a von willebrand factor domain-containing protein n=1 Tax=Stylonychia lemnae TaxID=5949 RepID=A0A078AXN5_STYLE|nr:type a von willebrand factor domain-containing protein [Stylonychia lemnae]|eukprot:CDW86904.1 type a von willebrand factor domain-containing protein [Stylonychia lemnae]
MQSKMAQKKEAMPQLRSQQYVEDGLIKNSSPVRRRSRSKSRSRSNSSQGSNKSGHRNRSIEMVHSDDLEGALNLSDCDDNAQESRSKQARQRKRPARIFKQEVDTNVFNISMQTLKKDSELATGDPVFCKQCNACFNFYSQVTQQAKEMIKVQNYEEEVKGDEVYEQSVPQIWICEFCNFENKVDFETEELPKSNQVTYILEAAAQVKEKKIVGNQDITVVFCIDISGSMCVSQPIAGKHSIKGDKTQALRNLMQFSDGSDQRLQGEDNVTYISRLQCLQAAIESQLIDMAIGAPDRKVGIVTFNSEVTIIGDGSKAPQIIAGDKLFSYDYLIENGTAEGQNRLQHAINKTKDQLVNQIMSVEETGPTALGPALATAISMAAQGNPGSTVVLCTDGLANVGLGAFDEIKTEEESKKVDQFYESLGEFAKNKGVTVSIVSIAGEECNIDTLSTISEHTGGSVERVDPVQLTQNFSNILKLPVIATNVITRIKLHKGLEFRNEDVNNLSEDKTLLARDMGNVTDETEFTFEYRLKSIKDLIKMDDVDLTKIQSFPFQAQITYNSLDGNKCIRIITNQKSISNDRTDLEKNANYEILSTNAIQKSSQMAKRGNMREAQAYAKVWKRKMKSNIQNVEQDIQYNNFNNHFGQVYEMINEENDQSDCEAEAEERKQDEEHKVSSAQTQPAKKGFFKKLGDKISTELYKASKTNKTSLNK